MPDIPFLEPKLADVIRWQVERNKKRNPTGIVSLSLHLLTTDVIRAGTRKPGRQRRQEVFREWLTTAYELDSLKGYERFRDVTLLGHHLRDYLG